MNGIRLGSFRLTLYDTDVIILNPTLKVWLGPFRKNNVIDLRLLTYRFGPQNDWFKILLVGPIPEVQ